MIEQFKDGMGSFFLKWYHDSTINDNLCHQEIKWMQSLNMLIETKVVFVGDYLSWNVSIVI
jgi:hypothetical protein